MAKRPPACIKKDIFYLFPLMKNELRLNSVFTIVGLLVGPTRLPLRAISRFGMSIHVK